jgi:3D (Asp-Asp-Asp) domain-containing protein
MGKMKKTLLGLLLCTCIGYVAVDKQLYKKIDTHAEQKSTYCHAPKISTVNDKLDNRSKDTVTQLTTTNHQAPATHDTHAPSAREKLAAEQSVEVVATGYSPGYESTGKSPGHPAYGITYSGLQAVRDEAAISTIAADLDVFPLGTVLFIPGYGYGVVADIGSAIKGGKIDLYFDTEDQVYREWGKRKLAVYVVQRGQGKMSRALWEKLKSELSPTIPVTYQLAK